jgi:hypothetical protein
MPDARDPYLEDRRKLDLAWRLLRHGARTQTITRWTGLSARRVRSLLKKYRTRSTELKIQRPRGDSPFNMELLLRSPQRRYEAALVARTHQELRRQTAPEMKGDDFDLEAGELACRAYEAFLRNRPQSVLTIDQAILVLSTITRKVEFSLGCCSSCRAPVLIDLLSVTVRRCGCCSAMVNTSGRPIKDEPSERVSTVGQAACSD